MFLALIIKVFNAKKSKMFLPETAQKTRADFPSLNQITFLVPFQRVILYNILRMPTDAEVLQDPEHDGARTRLGPPLPGRSPRMVVVGPSTVLQLDGPPRSSGVPAAPSSAP